MIANTFQIELTLITTLTTTLIKFTQGVLPSYCNYQLNMNDCGGPPTAVFSYWKPGSRCEIKFWRGCPTLNKFPSQYLCLHYCIGKFDSNSIEQEDDITNNIVEPSEDPCAGKINTGDCGGNKKVVYTYDVKSRSCKKVLWKGCKSDNMFSSKDTCDEMCLKFDANSFSISQKIDNLDPAQLEQLNNILDDFLNQGKEDAATSKPTNELKNSGEVTQNPGDNITEQGHATSEDTSPATEATNTTTAAG